MVSSLVAVEGALFRHHAAMVRYTFRGVLRIESHHAFVQSGHAGMVQYEGVRCILFSF